MAESNKNEEGVDLKKVYRRVKSRKKLFFKVWIITFVVACAIILPIPRSYTSTVTLAPESSEDAGSSLSALASSFGFGGMDMGTGDAFYPEIYPDVIATNEFIVGLFDVQVESADGTIKMDYYNYMAFNQKQTLYMIPFDKLKREIKNLFQKPEPPTPKEKINPNHLDIFTNGVVKGINNKIDCSVSKMTNVITITVEDQDPYICAQMADTVREHLQSFITEYRTKKARMDAAYYKSLEEQALAEYDSVMHVYSEYCDAHQNVILQSYASERDRLENELSNKLQAYNTISAQYQAAAAKVQERTPAFTIISAPCVPVKATSPKRMVFVAFMLVLTTMGTAAWIMRKELVRWF